MAATLPDTLTVSYILTKIDIDGLKETESSKGVSDEQVNQYLSENGVVVEEQTDSSQDKRKAYDALKANGSKFWVQHYTLHPNIKYVKNWLWVHGKYRSQMETLQSMADSLAGLEKAADVTSAAKKLLAAYNKFVGKIEKHSEFEDTQLFKFFLDEKIANDDATVAAFKKLMEQHEQVNMITELQDCLQKLSTQDDGELKEKAKSSMAAYVKDMLDHLDEEERTIVALWLQLSPQEYKKYRSYLSWKYAMMY